MSIPKEKTVRIPENIRLQLHELEQRLGYKFKNLRHLYHALLHKSYVNEVNDKKLPDNERLEFLGDAVLEFVATEYLYQKYPEETEGWLTVMRSFIVERQNCTKIAKQLDLQKHIFVGRGERSEHRPLRRSIMANAFEALVAAVYIDGGIEAVREFVLYLINKYTPNVEAAAYSNYKAELQNFSQKEFNKIPQYRLLAESGPDHEKMFEICVFIGDTPYGQGKGGTKKASQQQAAKMALKKLGIKPIVPDSNSKS